MKRIIMLGLLMVLTIGFSCSDSSDGDNVPVQPQISFLFSHNWDGQAVSSADFNSLQFTNANGDIQSIERLRYVISDIEFRTAANELLSFDVYNFVDVTNGTNLTYDLPQRMPPGTYNLSFTFGFDNEDNARNYPELNSANFNVPEMLGGGYHYMQLDGKYIDSNDAEANYNYHAIRAVDNPGMNPTFPQDTFIIVNLGSITVTDDTSFTINVNIAEWFKNPNTWDLNVLNTELMANSAAQILMFENGQSVFSLADIDED